MDKLAKRQLIAIGISSIVLISVISSVIYFSSKKSETNIISIANLDNDLVDLKGNLTANIKVNKTSYYKGDNININIFYNITDNPANVSTVQIEVLDLELNRKAKQNLTIDRYFTAGAYTEEYSITPSFDIDGFVALTDKNYTLTKMIVFYKQSLRYLNFTTSLNISLVGELYPEYEQLINKIWNIDRQENATITINNTKFNFNSTAINATITINTTIETTGYTGIEYHLTGNNESQVYINIIKNYRINDSGIVGIGNLNGTYNLTIDIQINNNENISLDLSLKTRKIVILTVVASNNWEETSSDGLTFRPPNYYMKQVSDYYNFIFNISFVVLTVINFNFEQSTDLFLMRDEAQLAVGKELMLQNNIWTSDVGINKKNAGADILIILTNATMLHLGIVFGSTSGNFNIAINARGSLNTGQTSIELRLPSQFADNLIQHEVSHIFNAPDRWTETDPPSIMSKSRPNDAFYDILDGKFWLTRTNWLEADIQTMIATALNLYIEGHY